MPSTHQDLQSLTQELESALLSVDRVSAKAILTTPRPGLTALQLIDQLVVPVLAKIGTGWSDGIYSLSQVYMSGRICEELVDIILPPLDASRTSQPNMAIAALEDYHMLGKRIVYSTLRASGYELSNLGRMACQELAEHVQKEKIQILLISVLMLPSALKVKKLREFLDRSETSVKILVGGAPFRFDERLWLEVEADGVGHTASEAVDLVKGMIEELS
ncbi:MAG: cobalamin-dependent protein [Anaerolineaceae bacterium]|nr:cobalamin-dependent protein [Anaerolineaceae bacterium]